MNLKKVYNGDVPIWIQHVFTVVVTLITMTAIGSVAWTLWRLDLHYFNRRLIQRL